MENRPHEDSESKEAAAAALLSRESYESVQRLSKCPSDLPSSENRYEVIAAAMKGDDHGMGGSTSRVVNYGGPHGNGSLFSMSKAEYAKLEKREAKYLRIAQKILSACGITIGGDKPYDMVVHNPMLFRRVIRKGSLGLGEAYMEGWWDTRDFYALDDFFKRILQSGIEYYFPNNAKDMLNIIRAKVHNPQTKSKSRRVGMQHYDIGNEFFRNMLGPRMQYSCAYWEKHVGSAEDHMIKPVETLDEAQELKLHMIGEKLRLRPGMEVLDCGCGWGALAAFLSEKYSVKVTGITISEEQREGAARLVKDDPNVTILNRDYRDATFDRKFDRIVSVGMFEHVGPKNYKTFFKHMRRLLRDDDPEAVLLLHTIGSKTTMSSADQWYLKYIFPGGCLPSISSIGKGIEAYFVMEDLHNFGFFYGLTLLAWRSNFLVHWNKSAESTKPGADAFFRMFYYYLSSSAGAFEARDLQLWQVVLSPKGTPGYVSVYRP
ncbi:cyclopropane-fatty-acyl-phospholipid syntahse [Leishmania infantum JPCM5]|uniref:Cyclopropane-fatty-acyl-phospholipid_synthase n=2 Tax=Leishmania infantum TaxID=5671 RepID=A0A6L0WIT2_LEIIN|nr:cyclopropane-fatty-acyl-phospholipid syntahse [Leishmania infantum JPCM5]CAC9451252.1 cyclopropane-fatty-acyl-phospholipid_synthase [Leishmania infantum]CAM65755.1 cyclopropane-fatty-acyl-phospholipid syntahse [Leishmania infantum JPCM5]SUZ39372.1 cyclopropane-fatty-acyl-phospholipid_synthase [Leishmania infantum]|eukprot:XP_001463394.1 cyclopropane-fatty-acyl-phospholipid syntahse [Leishmania infantum JPCM5]